MHRTLILAALTPIALLAACSADKSFRAVAAATPAQQSVLLDKIKSLEGEWVGKNEKGETVTTAVYSVTSAGSAVREVMFPGTPHEMTNMYHMDGDTLVMTHYCAMGNQPRMRAHAGDGKTIAFTPDSVTNMTNPDAGYMGGMTVVFLDNDHVEFRWAHYKNGSAVTTADHNPVFTHTRKK
jgi:hypothetical protein